MTNKTKPTHTPGLRPPHDGYYPGEEAQRLKDINAELLSALKEILDLASNGEPFQGDMVERISSALVAKAEGRG